MKSILLLLFAFVLVTPAQAAVWESFNQWDNSWEQRYSDWVKAEWNQYIFSDEKSPYYGIATDCADASYAMRIIFAYENNLTFAAHDATRKSSKNVISNKMKRFDKHPAGFPRLKAFINFISAVLYTANLSDDTVPVALNTEALIPGIIYVKPKVHSYQIKEWSAQGIPVTINSTTPYSVKDMHKYLSFPSYIPEDTVNFTDGYRRFKRPNELHKPTSSLPGYSIEQFTASEHYDFNNNDFNEYVISRTSTQPETKYEKVRRLMFNICYSTYNRASVINESTAYFNKIRSQGRQCMNYSEFDQYSTFTRDKRLKDYFVRLQDYLTSTDNLRGEKFPLKQYAIDLFKNDSRTYKRSREQFLEFCSVPYKSGAELTVREIWQRIDNNLLVQNPNTTNDWRWGDYSQPFTTSCPTFEEIH